MGDGERTRSPVVTVDGTTVPCPGSLVGVFGGTYSLDGWYTRGRELCTYSRVCVHVYVKRVVERLRDTAGEV